MSKKHDMVDHPPHYKGNGLESIEVIEGWGLGFHLGNAMKYIIRADRKGNELQDLKKALWYLQRAHDVDPGLSVGVQNLGPHIPAITEAFCLQGIKAYIVNDIIFAQYTYDALDRAIALLETLIEHKSSAAGKRA